MSFLSPQRVCPRAAANGTQDPAVQPPPETWRVHLSLSKVSFSVALR